MKFLQFLANIFKTRKPKRERLDFVREMIKDIEKRDKLKNK